MLAHRVAWELMCGPIPDGMCVLHHCDNPGCCNAKRHLFIGTKADNVHDMIAKGRKVQVRGEDAPGAKLREIDVMEIRRRYSAGGVTYKSLGREFGVAKLEVARIVRRQAWPHLPIAGNLETGAAGGPGPRK